MADKYLNYTGLQYYHNRIKTEFADKDEIPVNTSDLTNDGDGTSPFATEDYVDENGGKIDVIKVNDVALPITSKAVNIDLSDYALESDIPTATSDLTNDSDYQTSNDVSGAIATALANGNNPYQTESDVDGKISTAISSVYRYKGSVATYNDLPASGNTTGDVWDVQDTGINYAWNGTGWDALGASVDTSTLWSSVSGQTNSLIAITTAEIDTIVGA